MTDIYNCVIIMATTIQSNPLVDFMDTIINNNIYISNNLIAYRNIYLAVKNQGILIISNSIFFILGFR